MSLVLASQHAGIEQVVSCSQGEHMKSRAGALIGELEQAGIPVVCFDQVRRPVGLAERWSMSPAQVPWIRRHVHEFDAVHVHGIWNVGAFSGLGFASRRGVPVVVTAHESLTAVDIDTSRSRLRRLQKLVLKSAYLRWTTLFVLTSGLETTTSLPESAPRETIPYALVDPARSMPELIPRGTGQELRIGYLGRIARKKNLPLLIESLTQLPDHVRLVVAGDPSGELGQAARRLAQERGVAGRVQWLGFVSPEHRQEFLDGVDILAMPS
jgi:glycosyltransferase involved in cell wall biosynthesis